ncbi:acetyl-CoA carboxylase biotin carboxyl carrier protein, partial [Deinococcus aquaticus]
QPAPEAAASAPAPAPSKGTPVKAPIVGTFYASSSPDAPAYVKVGDTVAAGQVLCIIEAMKLMNEIEAEMGGTVREILVKNAEPVEYGQTLFIIE